MSCKLVSLCDSVEKYLYIFKYFEEDNIFNEGRKYLLIEYTKAVALNNPEIASEINRLLNEFLEIHYPSTHWCIVV